MTNEENSPMQQENAGPSSSVPGGRSSANRFAEAPKSSFNAMELTGIFVAVIPGIIVTLKVIFFAGGDLEILSLLVKTLNFPSLIIPTIYPFLGLALAMLIAHYHYYGLNPANKGKPFHMARPEGFIVEHRLFIVWIVCMSFIPLASALMGGFIIGVNAWSIIREESRKSKKEKGKDEYYSELGSSRVTVINLTVAVAFAFFLLLQSDQMWLPPERVAVDKRRPQLAYVLEVSDSFTTLFYPNHRVEIIRNERLRSRELCQLGDSFTDEFFFRPSFTSTRDSRSFLPHC
jgi:hypothetical protein